MMRIEQIALLALTLVVPSAIAQAQEAETEPVAVAEQAEQAEQAAAGKPARRRECGTGRRRRDVAHRARRAQA